MSALSHHLGSDAGPNKGVDDKTNEIITQVETVLHQLVLQGRVCTMDALLTQRQVAQSIVEKGRRLCHDRQREPASSAPISS